MGGVVRNSQRSRHARIGEVDGGDGVGEQRRRVVRHAVGGEAALVAKEPHRGAGQELRGAAVLVDVVDVDEARVRERVTHDRHQQATLFVQRERLVRSLHRGRLERRRPHRLGGVGDVGDRHTGGLVLKLLNGLSWIEKRCVVVDARTTALIREPLHLEAAGRALVADELGVARVAVRRNFGCDPALHAWGGARTGPAVRPRSGGGRLRGRRGRHQEEDDERYKPGPHERIVTSAPQMRRSSSGRVARR